MASSRVMKLFLLLGFLPIIFCHKGHGIPNHIHEKLRNAHSFLDVVDRVHIIYHPEKTNSHIEKSFPTSAPRQEMRIVSGSFVSKSRKLAHSHARAQSLASPTAEQPLALHDDVDAHTADHLSLFSSIKQGNDTCKLQSVCVPVPIETEDPQIVIFPKCYEVMQCVGSCCEAYESCHPHSIRKIQKPIVELIYVGNDRFMLNKTMNITMEEHTSCSCLDCGSDAPQCADGFVLGPSCECECINRADSNNCRGAVEIVENNPKEEEEEILTTPATNDCVAARQLEGGGHRRGHRYRLFGRRRLGRLNIRLRRWNEQKCTCTCDNVSCGPGEFLDRQKCECTSTEVRMPTAKPATTSSPPIERSRLHEIDIASLPRLKANVLSKRN